MQGRRASPTSRPSVANSDAAFVAHCRARGLLVTEQRRAIYAVLAESREHPSAEQIHQAVRHRLPRLSLATVYKNLELLRAIGAVSDVNSLHEHGRYEAALPGTGAGQPHHHLVCIGCKRVLDLYDSRFDAFRFGAEQAQGFEVRAVRVQVEGFCPKCRAARTARR
jgi:Fur family transcriptional regulator, peroxide stress response regulator